MPRQLTPRSICAKAIIIAAAIVVVPVRSLAEHDDAGHLAVADDEQRQDQLVWDYGEFTSGFADKDWTRVAPFVGPETKVGLGGDMGLDGLVRVFGSDEDCHGKMASALQLGCRKVGEGIGMVCLSPPQSGPDVVYLGPRASFRFAGESGRWIVEHLSCGGD